MYNQMMIDIETMGANPTAPILSIGAVAYDIDTGQQDEGFVVNIDFDSAFYNRTPDPATVKWWMGQTKEAQDELINRETVTIIEGLKQLAAYIDKHMPGSTASPNGDFKGREIWANDPDFDLVILSTAMKQFHITVPWPFWGGRSCRTVCAMLDGVYRRYNFPREGTHHSALDDCRYQIEYITKMWTFARDRILGKAA